LALVLVAGALTSCTDGSVTPARGIPAFETVPHGEPSFFVTSRGLDGGDLGGLEGADAHCRALASEAGLGARDWRAYLSTQALPGAPAINARDRIGEGPWFNVENIRIAINQAHLHGDTLDLAREGNLVSQGSALTEAGERTGGKGDPVLRHDILTGSRVDGRAYGNEFDRTCRNWTYSGEDGSAQVGHSDRDTIGLSISWNSAHQTIGCTSKKLQATGGDGLFYCFAADPARYIETPERAE
jgi:hypothetical protein